jgi:hypothetical protein
MVSVQQYIERVTGKYYIIRGENDIEFINQILKDNGFKARNYKFDNVEQFIKDKTDVVLVQCYVENEEKELVTDLRWYEFPAQKVQS